MDDDIKEIKRYIKIKDYNNLEEILSTFMIQTKTIQNENFDILCYTIENECSDTLMK